MPISHDFQYTYDFSSEFPIKQLEKGSDSEGVYTGIVTVPQTGGYVLLFHQAVSVSEINGESVGDLSRSLYYGLHCGRRGCKMNLDAGDNRLTFHLADPGQAEIFLQSPPSVAQVPEWFTGTTPPAPYSRPFSMPDEPAIPEDRSVWEIGRWTPGAGHGKSPGRFGFFKGDGLLDCAMTAFGLVDKMFMCGHPKYRKPYRWGYCVLPGQEKAVLTGDHIEINQLAVKWESQGVQIHYSLGSAGIITECDTQDMKLSNLEFAGSYRYVLTASRICTLDKFRPDHLTENFLMLFGSNTFPDIPLLVCLDRKPEKIWISRNEYGLLTAITFGGCRRMITATPFGMESFEPRTPKDKDFLTDAARRCRVWSRAFMAFPSNCREYFRNDPETGQCHITQIYSYRMLKDQWNTKPLMLAPFPPAAALSGTAQWQSDAVDLRFPTKYGPLYTLEGKRSSYTLPMLPYRAEFPLSSPGSEAAVKLKEGTRDYFEFQEHFPPDTVTGGLFGAPYYRYAFAAMAFNFMDRQDMDRLTDRIKEVFAVTADPDSRYISLLGHFRTLFNMKEHTRESRLKYYSAPELVRKSLKMTYRRKEPFTGAEYNATFLNTAWIYEHPKITDEEIEASKDWFIETDWGLGISFYSLYLCVLASGQFDLIRKNWPLYVRMMDYLDIFHDWACMASGYSETGCMWNEGADYGAYPAYVNLAEIAGDEPRKQFAIYLGSQHLALRLAIFRSSQQYFYRWFGVAPYGVTKAFREEEAPSFQFQGYPKNLDRERLRMGQLHTCITEGTFPIVLRHFKLFLQDEYRITAKKYLDQFLDEKRNDITNFWHRCVVPTMILLEMAEDPDIPESMVREKLAKAKAMECIIPECRDIGSFVTFQPETLYESLILAALESRNQPLLLEHWNNLRIMDGIWLKDRKEALIRFESAGEKSKILCRVKCAPAEISVPFKLDGDQLTLIPEKGCGEIRVRFP